MKDRIAIVKKIGKNICAFILALGMLFSSTQLDVLLSAKMLGNEYYIKYIDNNYQTTRKTALDMICAPGESATIETKLPSGYQMDNETPFRIFKKAPAGSSTGPEVTDSGYFYAVGSAGSGSTVRYTLNLGEKTPSPGYDVEEAIQKIGTTSYTLEAFYSTPDGEKGSGFGNWQTKQWAESGATSSDPSINHPSLVIPTLVTATAETPPPLLFDTTISFKLSMKTNTDNSVSLEYGETKADGYYATLLGEHPVIENATITPENGKQVVVVKFKNADGFISFALNDISTTEYPLHGDGGLLNLEVSATWSRPRVNSLTLATHTPQEAITSEAQFLQAITKGKPETTLAEDDQPYMKLATGDELGYDGGIFSSTIAVRETVPRYNSKLKIRWEFVPDDSMNTITVPPDTVTWENGQIKIIEPPEDVYGSLVAKICYVRQGQTSPNPADQPAGWDTVDLENPSAAHAIIPIRVLGAGAPAKVKFSQKLSAFYDKNAAGKFVVRGEASSWENIPGTPITFNMDVYDGSVSPEVYMPRDKTESFALDPYKLSGTIDFGKSKGAATRLVVQQTKIGGKGGVRLSYNDAVDYQWGSDIKPPEGSTASNPVPLTFTLQAIEEGNVRLTFYFYNQKGEQIPDPLTIAITIADSSPNPDPNLRSLELKTEIPSPNSITDPDKKQSWETFSELYPGGVIDFGFDPEKTDYPEIINIPNIVEELQLTPTYNVMNNKNDIVVKLSDSKFKLADGTQSDQVTLKSGQKTPFFPLPELMPVKVQVFCRAQNGFEVTYTLTVMRASKSNESSLQDLIVRPDKNSPEEDNFVLTPEEFDPEWPTYKVTVPYKYDTVNIKAIAKDYWATKIEFTQSPPKATNPNLLSRISDAFQRSNQQDIELHYTPGVNGAAADNKTIVTVKVTSESGIYQTYTVEITRDDPSDDASIKEPKISYWVANDHRTELTAELDGGFYPDDPEIFTKLVEYSTDRIRIKVTPNDYRANKVTVSIEGTRIVKEMLCKSVGTEPKELQFDFDAKEVVFPKDTNTLRFIVQVYPESSQVNPPPKPSPEKPYVIIVERKEPSRDLTAEVTLKDMLTESNIDFGYSNVIDDYSVTEVEYTPGDMKVLVLVKPKDPKTTVLVQGKSPRPDGTAVSLTAGTTTTIKILLTAEDGSTRTITIPLKYNGPSKNCYLSDLNAGGFKFLPEPTNFIKTKTSYKIEIPKGTASFPVTATLLKDGSKDDSSKATITINDKPVGDGEAYTFQPTEKTGKITVVVTAQDGKTKRTYTINYKNWNLLVPNDENTLKDLKLDYGDMSPEFSPSTQEYDFYVKPDAMQIKIFPKLKDPDGAIRVVAGKVLTEFDGAYSVSLMDDEMDIHIYVWSEKDVVESGINSATDNTTDQAPAGEAAGTGTTTDTRLDKARARDYVIHVYRNDEEKIGNLKPITADMVDFVTADPIVIDITKYPIISAEVFNTLKTDYADKSILFKGNDYTLQVFGEDIDGLVPHTDTFDLRFSFFTPDQDKIEELLDDIGSNGRVDPVYYYFNQHGALPAEMLLTVDLGRHYRNRYLYWNYYNQERSRIDYYGYVRTNATGTFSVPISHFSTFLTTTTKIRGAENKSEEYGNPELSPTPQENLNAPASANKRIPNTGAGVVG